jgi:hypothetical protein
MRSRGVVLSGAGLGLLGLGVAPIGTATQVGVALIVVGAGLFTVGVTLPLLSGFKVSAGGFEATLRERDVAFRTAVAPEEQRMLQLAALLGTDPSAAPRILEQALARAYAGPPSDAPADRTLQQVVKVAEAHEGHDGDSTLQALRRLPPKRRSALVLDLLGGIAAGEAHRVLGRTREKVEEDVAEGLSELPKLLATAAAEGLT